MLDTSIIADNRMERNSPMYLHPRTRTLWTASGASSEVS